MVSRYIRKLCLSLQLVLIACSASAQQIGQMTDELKQEVTGLLELSVYVITDVMGGFYAARENGSYGADDLERVRRDVPTWPEGRESNIFIRDKVLEKGYRFLTRPGIDEIDGALVQVNPRSRNFIAEILCLKRETSNGKLYEYWVVKAWSESRPIRDIYFFITEAESLDQPRTILVADNRYIREYAVTDTYTMAFPETDFPVLYKLAAWLYPSAFPESDLKSKHVILSVDGEYLSGPYEGRRAAESQRIMTPDEVRDYFNVQP